MQQFTNINWLTFSYILWKTARHLQ